MATAPKTMPAPYMVDFSIRLATFAGTPIVTSDAEGSPQAMLGQICLTALQATLEIDKNLDAEKKIKRAIFAEWLYKAMKAEKPVPLTSEEVTELKSRISATMPIAVTLAAARLLDPNAAVARPLD